MKTKRSLLWLTPSAPGPAPVLPVLPSWSIRRLDLSKSPPSTLEGLADTRIGVLDLSRFPAAGVPDLEGWIELLSPTLWIGVLDPAHREIKQAEAMVALYCSDFHTHPLDPVRLDTVLGHLWGMADLQRRLAAPTRPDALPWELTGGSPAIVTARELLQRFANTLDPIIIQGENGSGKDVAARFIHDCSPVRYGPFVTINCAALPLTMSDTQRRSAEPPAPGDSFPTQRKAAEGGTLVLAGVEDLLPEQQGLLLPLLADHPAPPAGGAQRRPRIVATCRTALDTLVSQGRFREDVYYRLGGLEVLLPALQHRLEDLPELANRLLATLHSSSGIGHRHLSEKSLQWLLDYPWPGNLRELKNRLRQAVLVSNHPTITPEMLGFQSLLTTGARPASLSLEQFRARAERQAVMCSLALTHHNVSAAARLLEISRVSFYRLLAKHDASLHAAAPHTPNASNSG